MPRNDLVIYEGTRMCKGCRSDVDAIKYQLCPFAEKRGDTSIDEYCVCCSCERAQCDAIKFGMVKS